MTDNAMLTTAKEWTRLTPENADSELEPVRCKQQDNGLYLFEAGCTDFVLSPAEALAFAAQLPEVKALVHSLRVLERYSATGTLEFYGCDLCGQTAKNPDKVIHDPGCAFAALAPWRRPTMQLNPSTAPTPESYEKGVQQQHYDRPLPCDLGRGCCPMCGRPRRECEQYGCEEED